MAILNINILTSPEGTTYRTLPPKSNLWPFWDVQLQFWAHCDRRSDLVAPPPCCCFVVQPQKKGLGFDRSICSFDGNPEHWFTNIDHQSMCHCAIEYDWKSHHVQTIQVIYIHPPSSNNSNYLVAININEPWLKRSHHWLFGQSLQVNNAPLTLAVWCYFLGISKKVCLGHDWITLW